MTTIIDTFWDKIVGKSETKPSTLPAHLKTATIKITVISKGDKP
jgi:hypothetical protein